MCLQQGCGGSLDSVGGFSEGDLVDLIAFVEFLMFFHLTYSENWRKILYSRPLGKKANQDNLF